MRIGIVGITPERSWAALSHVPALQNLRGFEIAGVANRSERSSREAGAALGLHAYSSVYAMISDPQVDLITVTVKVPHHREIVDAALDAGKMVYCEWPLGNGLGDAMAMASKARARGIRTVVGMQARVSPVIRYVRDLVREGYVGQVLSTTLIGSGISWGPQISAVHEYLHDCSNGATLLSIPLGHTLDALCFCLGEFTEVLASMTIRRENYTIIETGEQRPMRGPDQVVFSGRLGDGVVAAVHYRGGTSRGTNLLWEVNGTEGDLRITSVAGHAQMFDLFLEGGRKEETSLQKLQPPESYRSVPSAIKGFAVNVGELYARFAMGAQHPDPAPDFDAAVQRHRLLGAIEQSAQSGGRCRV